MALGATKKNKLSDTKASQAVQKSLREYQGYWRKAKGGKSPATIRVNKDQLKKLGVDSGFYFEGSILELL